MLFWCPVFARIKNFTFFASVSSSYFGVHLTMFETIIFEDVPLVEFMYLVFTHMPGERYCRQLRSLLLSLCYIFQALINSLVC